MKGYFSTIRSLLIYPLLFLTFHSIFSQDYGNRRVTYFLIDGMSMDVFNSQLSTGNLPSISNLIDQGIYVENGVVSFPSMTGFGFFPYITGMEATKSGIAGLRWFDRSLSVGNLRNYVGRTNVYMNEDITDSIKTVFELVEPGSSSTINSFLNRGATISEKTSWSLTAAKYEGHHFFKGLGKMPFIGNKLSQNHFQNNQKVIDKAIVQLEEDPIVQFVVFPSLDSYNHIHGTDSTYTMLLRHIDMMIGEYVDSCQMKDENNERMICVISDHGVRDVIKNVDPRSVMKDSFNIDLHRGKATHIRSGRLSEKISDFEDKDGYYVINGNLTAYVYFKNPYTQSWSEILNDETLRSFPTDNGNIDLVRTFCNLEGIQLVVSRSNGEVRVTSRRGLGIISCNEEKYVYSVSRNDPLNVPEKLLEIPLTDREWLDNTYSSEYPCAVPTLFNLMNMPEAPDIILMAENGYDLAASYEIFVGNYKGGHGHLHRDLTLVPMILSSPSLRMNIFSNASSADIGATVFDFLGVKTDYLLDGQSLLR